MTTLVTVSTLLSAVASIAAAIAAFVSLRVSKQSISFAESNALANHHLSASLKYSEIVKELNESTRVLSDMSINLWIEWAKEIESKDHRKLGGVDPRPLRHVIINAGEMLSNYGSYNSLRGIRSASRAILSVIRDGIDGICDDEYEKLLNQADGAHKGFENIFGNPSECQDIASAPAFRWAYYQLFKRVDSDDWLKIWSDAWLENGWLDSYKVEYLRVKVIFENAYESLKEEQAKLVHSTLPLKCNPQLFQKYNEIFEIIDLVVEDCNIEKLESYRDWRFKEELSLLVVCSIAIVIFLSQQLDLIYLNARV